METFITSIVVIISQHSTYVNHHIIHFKYIQLYLSIIPQKTWKQKTKAKAKMRHHCTPIRMSKIKILNLGILSTGKDTER